jgi:hypothetical protein
MGVVVVQEIANRLRLRLPDDFSRRMLDATMAAFVQPENPLRLTFFSVGMREMVGHIFHLLAPDPLVEGCSWFAKGHDTVTRRQRAKYIIQGGLSDEFLQSISVDMANLYNAVRPMIDGLNKYVHVREATLVTDPTSIENVAVEVLTFFADLLEAIQSCRDQITDALED